MEEEDVYQVENEGMEKQFYVFDKLGMECDDEFSDDDDSEITWEENDSTNVKDLSYPETVHIQKRQRRLKELEILHQEKDLNVQKIRQELKECCMRIETLERERKEVEEDIQQQEHANNIAALFRLRAQHRRLCDELRGEEDLQAKITLKLQENERDMFEVELEQGKLMRLYEEHKNDDAKYEAQLLLEAKQRLEAEETAILQAEKRKKKSTKDVEKQKLEHKKAFEDAKKYNQKSIQYLKESMARARQEQADKEVKIREELEKRMQVILSLKKNITTSRENLQAMQARKAAKSTTEKQKKDRQASMVSESENFQQQMLQKKYLQEFEKKKQEFAEEQKTLKAEIMAKILREESTMEKKKKIYPVLFPDAQKSEHKTSEVWKFKEKLLQYIENSSEDDRVINTPEQEWRSPSQISDEETVTEQIPNHFTQDVNDQLVDEESLNLPEFPGLWDNDHTPSKDETVSKRLGVGTSKMEQEILARQLEKQRSGIVQKQVAAGREFKGCPFYSKPDVIHFKNFDISQTYKKKATLINASYGITFCRLIAITDCLKDFIEVDFKPPGQISAGMSCEMAVTFKPLVNKDFQGEIMFRTHIGSFAVPLYCTTKKCDLVVDKQVIDFGCHTIGETITRTITLTNRGALNTYYQFLKSAPKRLLTGEMTELSVPTSEDLFDLDKQLHQEIKIGKITADEIGAFTSVKLPIIFAPLIPGETQMDFELVFSDPASKNITITARAKGVDVPVWLSNPNIDLKICMYDRLYQDSICACSRASTALQLKFEVCSELRNHLELLPKTGYIQAHSNFSFQLKFLPRKSLPEDAKKYFNKETRVLEAPMNILVANQTRSIPFIVHAIVTSSDLEIDSQTIDFGYCSIYESVWTTISLTNKSILSQEYGFVDIPEYVEVQPNDGFGVLLPLETLNIDIIVKAKEAKEYTFELICKSEINREFKISCQAVGVFPPLKLSHSVIHFAATALNDTSTVTLYVENSHTSQNEFIHSVPRIGKGEIAPVGPTLFEFVIPEYSYLSIAPAVGTVMPGEKCLVHLIFKPTLPDLLVQKEAVRMLCQAAETERILEKQEAESSKSDELSSKKRPLPKQMETRGSSPSTPKPKEMNNISDSSLFEPPNPVNIPLDSNEYNAALASMLRDFKEDFHTFVIPCFVKYQGSTDHKIPGYSPYSIHNTLYLEVNCPTVAPPIILISGNKQNMVDFGAIAVEQRVLKRIEIQNISHFHLNLKSSVLDPCGPFELLNSLRSLQPGATHNLIFSFTPAKSKMYYEPLEIRSVKGNLSLILTGCGIDPSVTCSVENILDVGYVLANQSRTVTFQLENATILNVMFSVKLDSLSYSKHREKQVLPEFLAPDGTSGSLVGTQNYGDQSVFSVTPIKGSIGPMQSQEFEVTFSPDHESMYYSDGMQVELFDKVAHTIQLKGAAREHLMFVEGGDPVDVPVESLTILPSYDVSDIPRVLKTVQLTLKSTKFDDKLTTALREFQVGCIRSTQANARKNVEFTIDSPQALHAKGFVIDPVKAMVEAGTVKVVTVSWTPPSGHDPLQTISATVKMSIKGDITENYQIILTAVVG
ncbi:cilia- and flagella-associated protein 74 isoform X1 [Hemiscyllium ocellatum]|uniref:cilia- and flagella-associated protein 74 isoform X1 n=1 Tax=Hemiscyllium ocellatum TaxID=170820 RepID=UPI002967117E|nr:cilia- and flagella-associated protein 74 isoform X1 [Hemiscyllium ocellatum]